jgi:hypothetical protein
MNCQRRNEFHCAAGIGATGVGFFKGTTDFPHSPCRAANSFTIGKAAVNTVTQLRMYWSVHCAVGYREKQHSEYKNLLCHRKQIPNLFNAQLPKAVCSE